ncbi:MAG: phospholipase [Alphaproteobacteria bacterium]|nr:phospholipase [Alphaproteobacteria bacterium]
MPDAAVLVAALKPLLHALDVLGVVARHFDPEEYDAVMAAVGAPDAELRAALPGLDALPTEFDTLRAALAGSGAEAIAAFVGLRAALESDDGVRAVFRALRHIPRARAALYPAAALLAPVSRFFLEPSRRDSAALLAALANPRPDTGVHHISNDPGSRGGYSLYVPEYATPDRAMPLVMALHGGSGNGRDFLWTWQRAARSHGAILVTPTATGATWALMGEDTDTPNLLRILGEVGGQWRVDPTRMLLTGMSDGGTFTYVSGLDPASPFTHLAPVAAAFHPILAQMADPDRLRGLPITIAHGERDWMFPVETARRAHEALAAAGAEVIYREFDDLSHTYPGELNGELLGWLAAP